MNKKFPLTSDEFKYVYSKVPRLCVDLVIPSSEGVLLGLRQKYGWEGMWHLPGGGVFYKELVTDAARRIGSQELGIDIKIDKFLGYVEYPDEDKERGFGYSVSLIFQCLPVQKDLTLDDQSSEVAYFKELPQNTVPEQKVFLERFVLTSL